MPGPAAPAGADPGPDAHADPHTDAHRDAPEHRHTAEFCENGAKAVAWEGDTRRIGPAFFAEHSLADLGTRTEYWMGQQGRLTEPMVRRAGGTH